MEIYKHGYETIISYYSYCKKVQVKCIISSLMSFARPLIEFNLSFSSHFYSFFSLLVFLVSDFYYSFQKAVGCRLIDGGFEFQPSYVFFFFPKTIKKLNENVLGKVKFYQRSSKSQQTLEIQ